MEDELLVLIAAGDALREAGFGVIETGTADEAALIIEAAPDEVCAVFTDIEMPGKMNGVRLASVVHDAWPSIAVLITSGRVAPAPADLPIGAAFVRKPYNLDHVATVLGRMTAI